MVKVIKGTSVFLFLTLSLVKGAAGGIASSKHDLRSSSAFGSTAQICKVCHVPHKSASTSFLIAPGRVYSGSVLTTYGGVVGAPTNSSAICLSCHDGTTAPAVGTTTTDFTHSHPFSVVYPTTKTGYGAAVGGKITGSYGALPLEGTSSNRMECGTCHNPHEKGVGSKFLRIENTNSNLCLTCHQK